MDDDIDDIFEGHFSAFCQGQHKSEKELCSPQRDSGMAIRF
jgi:hypothetical protein